MRWGVVIISAIYILLLSAIPYTYILLLYVHLSILYIHIHNYVITSDHLHMLLLYMSIIIVHIYHIIIHTLLLLWAYVDPCHAVMFILMLRCHYYFRFIIFIDAYYWCHCYIIYADLSLYLLLLLLLLLTALPLLRFSRHITLPWAAITYICQSRLSSALAMPLALFILMLPCCYSALFSFFALHYYAKIYIIDDIT